MPYAAKGPAPAFGRFLTFDHITFIVGNARQAAAHYCVHFGFTPFAYKGLETGSRDIASHVVKLNDIVLEFQSPLKPDHPADLTGHLTKHGDAIKVVAFAVEDIEAIVQTAKDAGAQVVQDVEEEFEGGGGGSVKTAVFAPFGDTVHKLVERTADFKGRFMPGYEQPDLKIHRLLEALPPAPLLAIDHLVGCQPDAQLEPVVNWYERALNFHRFWSVDDSQIHTEYSALRTTVIANWEETIKMPIVEPAPGLRKSQVHEFVEYFGGCGVQHVALRTEDIISGINLVYQLKTHPLIFTPVCFDYFAAIQILQSRGVEFLKTPPVYYQKIRELLSKSPVTVLEDLEVLEKLNILLDFDDTGYLLQIFTKPLQDRPTHFLEIIQRRKHQGFGAGNIKTLFEAVEYEQERRGNLVTEVKG